MDRVTRIVISSLTQLTDAAAAHVDRGSFSITGVTADLLTHTVPFSVPPLLHSLPLKAVVFPCIPLSLRLCAQK